MDEYPWLAGLLEGEGSFLRGIPSAPGVPVVALSMTDLDVVQRVADMLNIRYIHVKLRTRENPAWRPAYRVKLTGQRAVDLMHQLRPMMGERRQAQIDAALACWNPPWERNRERDQEILRLHQTGDYNYTQIGSAVGVSRQLARMVIRHKCTTHSHK
jgi:hypothetical protein